MDFGSDLFSCEMCNYTIPPCIVNSNRKRQETVSPRSNTYAELLAEQDLLHDIEGFPFLITLNKDVCTEVNSLVAQYCASKGIDKFDISPYQRKKDVKVSNMDTGDVLYLNLKKYIMAPYRPNHICITFNTGTERIYDSLFIDYFVYEKAKYKKKTAALLAELKVGDTVNAKFVFDYEVSNAKVIKITDHIIDLSVQINGVDHVTSQPKDNLIYIRKVR